MSWGSKQTTTSTNTGNQAYSNVTNPILAPGVAQLNQGILNQIPGLINKANAPVYGQAQQAGFISNLNDLANSATQHLNSQLASRGQLLSGVAEQGQQGIEQQRLGAATNFYENLPFMERQANLQNLAGALTTGMNISSAMPRGQSSSGTGTESGSGTQTTTQSPGLGQLVGGLAGAALGGVTGGLGAGLMGGFGSMIGAPGAAPGGFGGGFSQGFGNYMSPTGGYGGGFGGGYGGGWNAAQPIGSYGPGQGPFNYPGGRAPNYTFS